MINVHVFKMEFKRSMNSIIAWSVSVSLFLYLIIVLYPLVKDLYSNIPEEVLVFIELFGGTPNNVVEYFAVESGMTLQIVGSIYAALVGFNVINKEEFQKHSELVYTLPVSRQSFFYTKFLFVVFQIIVFSLMITLFSILGFLTVGDFPYVGNFLLFSLMNTLMLLFISILGFTLACLIKNASTPMLAMAIPLPLYVVLIISSLSKNKIIKALKHFTVFSFADATNFLKGSIDFEWISFTIFLIISIIGLFVSFKLFKNREFNI